MAVPKRKTSKSRRDRRASTKFIRPQIFGGCSNCTHPLLPHQACSECGFYRGRKVMKTKNDRTSVRTESRKKVADKAAQEQQAADSTQK
jgi:large subunit ribosomal protein L32